LDDTMQTNFTPEQLLDPQVRESEQILRTCVHCGFCTATCPTYVLLGDELDSPRGRIYLIKDMLEGGKPATGEVVKHIDRCLSCLSCMTTCPSGVNYMHLVDHARAHIEKTYRRPAAERLLRKVLATVLPRPGLFRAALMLARAGRFAAPLLRHLPQGSRLVAMLALAPKVPPSRPAAAAERVARPEGARKGRVALLAGCAQTVLAPEINEAATRLLTRHGFEVVSARGEGCCGALVHHLGREEQALDFARRNIDAWTAEIEGEGLDAIAITASGCGTLVKDYGFMLRDDRLYRDKAERVSALARDISEIIGMMDLPDAKPRDLVVAYHSACSMQHGQKIVTGPKSLLKRLGFVVKDPAEGHLCCGSAGTYNILQPEISAALRDRKVAHLEATGAQVIATGNIGCMTQIGQGSAVPIVHTVELVDWATGGPKPRSLAHLPV
jgi:glycolate oxidase iron-sulfur subunit